jgi:cyanophycin synthetase
MGEARVIVERLRSPAALAALAPALMAMRPPGGRVIGVLCADSRRSDAEIREAAALAGRLFHRLILTQEDRPGERAPGKVLALLTAGALAAGVPLNHIVRLAREAEAITRALAIARPGDLVVFLSPNPARIRARLSPALASQAA